MYMLINLLHQESLFVILQARLLSENKLKRQATPQIQQIASQGFQILGRIHRRYGGPQGPPLLHVNM